MIDTSAEPRVEERTSPSARMGLMLDLAVAGLVFVFALLAYLSTVSRSLGWGDASELMIAAYYLGIGHSPGYPTWMLVIYPFAHLPFGTVAERLNITNVVFGALGVAFLYWVLLTMTRRRVAAFVGALSFGFALTFWDTTTMLDVFTLHLVLTALILLVALWWRRERRDRQLYLLAWLIGISLGNHALTSLMIPALLYLVFAEEGARLLTAKRLFLLCAFFLLGFAVYCYLPIRGMANPPPHANHVDSLQQWVYHVSSPGARNVMFSKNPMVVLAKAGKFFRFLATHEFGWLGMALGMIGLAHLWRRDRRLLWFTALIFSVDFAYASNFSVFDAYVFYLPAHIMWGCYVAFGAAHVLAWTGQHIAARAKGRPVGLIRQYGAVSLLLLLTPLLLFAYHRDFVGAAGDVDPERFARAALGMVAPKAVILGDWWHIAPMAYLKYLEGVRTDVTLDSAASLESTAKFMSYTDPRVLRQSSAVYFTELLTNRADTLRQNDCYLVPEGPLWRVYAGRPPAGQVLTTVRTPPLASFDQDVGLTRATVPSTVLDPMRVFRMDLYWTALPGVSRKYKQVTVVIQNAKHAPVFWETTPLGHDLYPQHLLKPGQTVREPRRFYLGRPLAPGTYHVLVRVKGRRGAPFTCDRPASDDDQWSYRVATVTVKGK